MLTARILASVAIMLVPRKRSILMTCWFIRRPLRNIPRKSKKQRKLAQNHLQFRSHRHHPCLPQSRNLSTRHVMLHLSPRAHVTPSVYYSNAISVRDICVMRWLIRSAKTGEEPFVKSAVLSHNVSFCPKIKVELPLSSLL